MDTCRAASNANGEASLAARWEPFVQATAAPRVLRVSEFDHHSTSIQNAFALAISTVPPVLFLHSKVAIIL